MWQIFHCAELFSACILIIQIVTVPYQQSLSHYYFNKVTYYIETESLKQNKLVLIKILMKIASMNWIIILQIWINNKCSFELSFLRYSNCQLLTIFLCSKLWNVWDCSVVDCEICRKASWELLMLVKTSWGVHRFS